MLCSSLRSSAEGSPRYKMPCSCVFCVFVKLPMDNCVHRSKIVAPAVHKWCSPRTSCWGAKPYRSRLAVWAHWQWTRWCPMLQSWWVLVYSGTIRMKAFLGRQLEYAVWVICIVVAKVVDVSQGKCGHYNYLLQGGQSGDWTLVGATVSLPVRIVLEAHPASCAMARGKLARAWC
jgi:hypothetical protein